MSVPAIPLAKVAGRVQQRIMQPPRLNPHMVFAGQTRSGKDHLIRWGLLPYFAAARVVVLITKPTADDLTWHGWGNWISAAELPPAFGAGPDRTPRWVIPLPPGSGEQARRVLDVLKAAGDCIVVIGDTARLAELPSRGGLNCEGELTNIMRDAASNGLSVWACVNSANWAASGIRDQAAAYWIGHSGTEAADEFAKWAGLDRGGAERQALATLPPHQWIYTDHLDGELRAALTAAPAAGWRDESWTEPSPAAASVDRLRAALQLHDA